MESLPAGTPDLLVALAILTPIVTAFVNQWGRRKDRADIKEVKEHVSNTHKTNLRDDVDRVIHSQQEIKAVVFDMDRKVDCMSNRINVVDHKVEAYRKATEQVIANTEST